MSIPAVSVIVPVFNVSPFIGQCLDSLVNQTLDNVEIIVVDDGSTDETSEIVATFAKSYELVRVITQANQGLSAARNVGMKEAKGEFIGFVDGDDWVDHRMYESLYGAAVDKGAEIVIGNGKLIDSKTSVSKPIQDLRIWEELNVTDIGEPISPRSEPNLFRLDTSVCKRLFRRDFLESLKFNFPVGKIFEDIHAHFFLLLHAKSVVLINRDLYFYRINRPDRITDKSDRTLLQVFDAMQCVVNDLYRFEADMFIWVNFIWFQAWVLKWLRNQIDRECLEEFTNHSAALALRFRKEAMRAYLEQYCTDRKANIFVLEQLNQARCQEECQALSSEVLSLRELLENTHGQMNAIYASKSWKITKPLRWLVSKLGSP